MNGRSQTMSRPSVSSRHLTLCATWHTSWLGLATLIYVALPSICDQPVDWSASLNRLIRLPCWDQINCLSACLPVCLSADPPILRFADPPLIERCIVILNERYPATLFSIMTHLPFGTMDLVWYHRLFGAARRFLFANTTVSNRFRMKWLGGFSVVIAGNVSLKRSDAEERNWTCLVQV